ncbi:MAG: trehalase family glycosidase [Planctomycetota bacterium]|nr:trehalase family glycosidase [Planctomycetota bacterium]
MPKLLPTYAQTKDQLPSPIFDENPLYVQMYWKTWELAFRNFYEPKPGSGFVSQFIDAAFNQNIFLWDTCFLTMFCNYGHSLVPGIGSLDNFYAKQYEDGEICREIDRTTGRDYVEWINAQNQDLFSRWGRFSVTYVGREIPKPPPHVTLDALNHPILAWAELESFRVTGDRSRLGLVYEPLARYYRALRKYIRQGDGLYMTDWASMDNSPRNAHIAKGGTAVDTSSQMVLFANHLAQIADMLGKKDDAASFRKEAAELGQLINQKMWNPQRRFYFDLTVEGKQSPAKTIAAYWTLLAGVASEQQAQDMAAELRNPQSFGRKHRVPTTPADQAGFDPAGGYWCGAVWSPTNTMVIRGLQRYGMKELAQELAMEHQRAVGEVFQATGTVWENYAPDAPKPGKPAKPDFVGWTGIVPIMYFMEFAIGLRPDAAANRLDWALTSEGRCGCERFRFNGHVVSLVAEPADGQAGSRRVNVESDGDFRLQVEHGGKQTEFAVKKGGNVFVLQ